MNLCPLIRFLHSGSSLNRRFVILFHISLCVLGKLSCFSEFMLPGFSFFASTFIVGTSSPGKNPPGVEMFQNKTWFWHSEIIWTQKMEKNSELCDTLTLFYPFEQGVWRWKPGITSWNPLDVCVFECVCVWTHCHTAQVHCPRCHPVPVSHRKEEPSLGCSGSSRYCYTPEEENTHRHTLVHELMWLSVWVQSCILAWRSTVETKLEALMSCLLLTVGECALTGFFCLYF